MVGAANAGSREQCAQFGRALDRLAARLRGRSAAAGSAERASESV